MPRKPRSGCFNWTDKTDDLLMELHDDEALDWSDISKRIGPAPTACRARYEVIKSRRRIDAGIRISKVPNAVALECNRRIAARSERDDEALRRGHCTPAFFNDPPPGWSALDRKRAGA